MSASPKCVNLANGIDDRIPIMQDVGTGFLNVSRALKAISEVGENSHLPPKRWVDWSLTATAKALIAACEVENGLEEGVSYFSVRDGPNEYRGTYVHRHLFDHILAWANSRYGMRISRILDEYHNRERARLERENNGQSATIDRLEAEMRAFREEARRRHEAAQQEIARLNRTAAAIVGQNNNLSAQNTKLSDQVDELTDSNYELRDEVGELRGEVSDLRDEVDDLVDENTDLGVTVDGVREDLATAIDHLDVKSLASTQNPVDESLHHYFSAIEIQEGTVRTIRFVTGQRKYVERTVAGFVAADHLVLLELFYNANGIDLRNNCTVSFKSFRSDVIARVNEERKAAVDEFNPQLRAEINEHNSGVRRSEYRRYSDEKRSMTRLRVKDIPIKFKKLSVEYVANAYITFDDVVKIVRDTNEATQANPLVAP